MVRKQYGVKRKKAQKYELEESVVLANLCWRNSSTWKFWIKIPPEMTSATSLPRIIVAIVQGSIPDMAKEITIVVTNALSAAGSAIEPKTVYFPVRLAIHPSSKSVILAIKRRVTAGTKWCVATR